MPPLRHRREDIPLLVNGILAQLVAKGLPAVSVTPAAMELLERYSWPGNVRELRNALEQMVVLGNAEHVIDVPQLPPHLLAARDVIDEGIAMPWQFGAAGIDFYREMEAIEDRIIAQALRLSGGNKKEAARLLRVNRTTLLEKLKRKRAQGSPLAMLLGPPRTPATTDGRLFVGEPAEQLPPLPTPMIGGVRVA
jgi:DNA-binding NtrC family response regulator